MLHPALNALQTWLPRRWRSPPAINSVLWARVVDAHPFLSCLSPPENSLLRQLSGHFLQEKEFHGAHGLTVNDHMALSVAAQACLPLIHMGLPSGQQARAAAELLVWYSDFVGIVVQPGAAIAQREITDGAGVVHRYRETLAGEAMDRGPVMLSWADVAQTSSASTHGSNLVVHEFVHKIDMYGMTRGEHPDGAPPLSSGLRGAPTGQDARSLWRQTMTTAFADFQEQVAQATRFGAEPPWLDAYAATHPAEFFAVTSEAYFVQRTRFGQEFPALLPLFDGFYRRYPDQALQLSGAPVP